MVFWKSSSAKKLLTDLTVIDIQLQSIKDFKGKKAKLLEIADNIKKIIPRVKADFIAVAEEHRKKLPKYAAIIDGRLKKELSGFDFLISQIEKIPNFKEGDWGLDSLLDYLRQTVALIRKNDLENEDAFMRMELGKPVIENIEKELFARKVPAEYIELIDFARNKELFAQISEPHADALYVWIEKNPHIPSPIGSYDVSPQINVSEDNLTPFGKMFRSIVKNKEFIDLGSGHPNALNPAPAYAKAFGCKRYVGVDIDVKTRMEIGDFEQVYVCDEMLSFLSKLKDGSKFPQGRFFFLSALDTEAASGIWKFPDLARRYFEALHHEFDRVTKQGDAVLLGNKTTIPTGLFEQCGFTRQYAETGKSVWVKTNPAKQTYAP